MGRSPIRALLPLLLAGCGVLGHEEPFVDADNLVTRVGLLELCEEACVAQAEGEHCATEYYLEWCLENCSTVDGLIPDDCMAEAASAYECWSEQAWSCLDGSVLRSVQPRPVDPEACSDVEDRFWSCA